MPKMRNHHAVSPENLEATARARAMPLSGARRPRVGAPPTRTGGGSGVHPPVGTQGATWCTDIASSAPPPSPVPPREK